MIRLRHAGIFLVSFMVLVLLVHSFHRISRVTPVMADLTTLPVIVIDPGHGGIDGGAVNRSGKILEKDINLEIALMLKDYFTVNGFSVIMTRSTDISIHDEGITSVRKQKTSDLNNRLKIAQENPNSIFISIHQNKFSDERSKGTQIFYSPNDPYSERYAELLQDNFVEMLQPENNRKQKKAGKNLFLMYRAECPAVLVECGFLSNPGETALLTDGEYQSKVAFVILSSTLEFLGLNQAAVTD